MAHEGQGAPGIAGRGIELASLSGVMIVSVIVVGSAPPFNHADTSMKSRAIRFSTVTVPSSRSRLLTSVCRRRTQTCPSSGRRSAPSRWRREGLRP